MYRKSKLMNSKKILKITTETGSIYYLDLDNKLIMKIFGELTPRQQKDTWQKYKEIIYLEDRRLLIKWHIEDQQLLSSTINLNMDNAEPCTITSCIVSKKHIDLIS